MSRPKLQLKVWNIKNLNIRKLDVTNIIRKSKRKIYLYKTNYDLNTRQKINPEQINSSLNP